MGVRMSSVTSLAKFSEDLRRLPRVVAQKVAAKAAPALTATAQRSFAQSEDPYGLPWAPGFDGRDVTLRKSGRLRAKVVYVAIGTKLRVALGVPYAKYQIGKRPVFPRQLPEDYSRALERAAVDVCREELGR